MLLLTALTVGGSGASEVFAYLHPNMRERITAKAQALKAIPADKRVLFMVRQMQTAIETDGLHNVHKADPSWILHALKGESPTVVAVVLSSMPRETTRDLLGLLPETIRKGLPEHKAVAAIPAPTKHLVRQLFEKRLAPMPAENESKLTFQSIVHMPKADLGVVLRDLGLLELGQSFAAIGKMALAELCRRLPRPRAEELVDAVRTASGVDAPDRKIAESFLSKVVANFTDTEELFVRAGLWRLANALLLESPEFSAAMSQRLQRPLGLDLRQYIERARELAQRQEEGLKRLQDSILIRIRRLAMRQTLSPRYAQMPVTFHHAESANELVMPE